MKPPNSMMINHFPKVQGNTSVDSENSMVSGSFILNQMALLNKSNNMINNKMALKDINYLPAGAHSKLDPDFYYEDSSVNSIFNRG